MRVLLISVCIDEGKKKEKKRKKKGRVGATGVLCLDGSYYYTTARVFQHLNHTKIYMSDFSGETLSSTIIKLYHFRDINNSSRYQTLIRIRG